MKKKSKILSFAIGGSILIVGVIVWVIGMSILDWDFKRLDNTEYTAQAYECTSDINSVRIDVSSFPVTVKSGDAVSLDYYTADNSNINVQEQDGVLTVTEDYKYNPFKTGIFDFGRSSHKFALTVVSGVTVQITGSNGDVSFVGVDFESFSVDVSNADLNFIDCTIGELKITGKNVACVLSNVESDNVEIDSVNTTVEIKNSRMTKFFVDSTNLHIEVYETACKTVEFDGINTDCKLKSVTLDNLKIDSINLEAHIEIVGIESEYTVRTDGRGLPHTAIGTTDKFIEISGTNNDVTLRFV